MVELHHMKNRARQLFRQFRSAEKKGVFLVTGEVVFKKNRGVLIMGIVVHAKFGASVRFFGVLNLGEN